MKRRVKIRLTGFMKIILVSLAVILFIPTNLYSQKNLKQDWWTAILKKHNLEILANNNYENVFEMSDKNTTKDGIVTLENAIFITKPKNGSYMIIKSPFASHDLSGDFIVGKEVVIESFTLDSQDLEPVEKFECKQLKYYYNSGKGLITDIKTK